MGYTIVYDRKFIRSHDRYIPFCLSGSSNCTQTNFATGKEIRERSWGAFVYSDDMLLATQESLMDHVRHAHDGSRSQVLKFHSSWLGDKQMVKFFENGIKEAVTVEDIVEQCRTKPHCTLGGYFPNDDADKYPHDDWLIHSTYKVVLDGYISSSEELEEFVALAKRNKKNIKANAKGIVPLLYINVSLSETKPLRVYKREEIEEPCIAKCEHGYLVRASSDSISYTQDVEKAKVFSNSSEAWAEASMFDRGRGVRIIAKSKIRSPSEKNIVLSADRLGERVYILKLTKKSLYFSRFSRTAKRFKTEKEAYVWFEKYINGRFSEIKDPKTEVIGTNE